MCAMRRLVTLTASLLLASLLVAGSAYANLSGEGLIEGNDKNVTNFGFILIAAFPLFILLMSLLQWQLDKRKYRRKAAEKARGSNPHWTTGW